MTYMYSYNKRKIWQLLDITANHQCVITSYYVLAEFLFYKILISTIYSYRIFDGINS